MTGEYNLCYSPDGSNLAFNRTNKQLIYKKSVEPPQPPSIYGDIYVIVSIRPSYIEGEPIEDYEDIADWRMAVRLNRVFQLSPGIAITNLYNSPVTMPAEVSPYGIGLYPQAVSLYVDILIIQPSSGVEFPFSLSAVMQDDAINPPTYPKYTITIYGNSSRLLTNAIVTSR